MAHAFDTGLALAQRTVIRNAAVTLLSGLLRPTGYLQAVVRYGGVVRSWQDDVGCDLLRATLQGRAPAIAIAVADAAFEPAGLGGFNFTADLELLAYFYSKNPRNTELGRLSPDAAAAVSDAADPGLDIMLEHAQELLVGQRCGASATIKQVRPVREDELRTEAGETLWVQRYAITLGRKINANRGITQLIEEYRTAVRASDAPLLDIAAAPAGATQVGAIATYTTTTTHGRVAGEVVVIAGVAVGGYNGIHVIAATPTPTTFTAQLATSGLAPSGGGTVTPAPVASAETTIP